MMNEKTRVYVRRTLALMDRIENLTGRMFHEQFPETEKAFWQYADNNERHKLMIMYSNFTSRISNR